MQAAYTRCGRHMRALSVRRLQLGLAQPLQHIAGLRALATEAPKPIVVSPHQLSQVDDNNKEDEGHSDWYYVSWGSLFLFLVGGPFYFVYLLKEDDELRIFADEHFPAVVAAVKQLIDVDEVRHDAHYQNIEKFGEDETLVVPVDGADKVVTLPSTSTVAAAASSLGITEEQFINSARVAEPVPHHTLTLPTSLFQVSEDDILKLEGTLQELCDAESALRNATDLPRIEEAMRETRLQHLAAQQAQVQQHILAAKAQLREMSRKWYQFW